MDGVMFMINTVQQRREKEHLEDLQRLRGFRPIDDDFMRGMFQQNLPLAQFVLRIVTGKPFDDGTYILYVNGEYRGDDEIGKLMHDFNCTDADDMNYGLMAERTRYLKEDPEGVRMMCKAMEDMRDSARAEGMDLFAALVRKLSEQGRAEDIAKAAADSAYRDRLLVELSIQV